VAGKEEEGQLCSRRTLLEPLQCVEEPATVEVEAARRLAIAGNHLEAMLGEKLRHAPGIAHGVAERRKPDGGRGAPGVRVLPDHQRDAARLRR
jgi:hypothetical protein